MRRQADEGSRTVTNESPTRSTAVDLSGSCLCGGVGYRCRGPLERIARCFCVQCRKASGGECATNADAAPGSFRVISGGDLLREFESSPGQMRVFCGRCGSPVYKRYVDEPDRARIRLGLLDEMFDGRPDLQVYTSERMHLTRIDDSIQSFEGGLDSPAYSSSR